jgi:hypothetical protein
MGGSVRTLHDRVLLDLTQRFGGSGEVPTPSGRSSGFSLGASFADLVIPQGRRVAVVEIKIGNPELPLPSSTSSRMRLLGEQARRSFSNKDITTVLVTNYSVTPDEKKEFEDEGVKIVPVASALSRYDRQRFSREFAEIVGLTPTSAALDASL